VKARRTQTNVKELISDDVDDDRLRWRNLHAAAEVPVRRSTVLRFVRPWPSSRLFCATMKSKKPTNSKGSIDDSDLAAGQCSSSLCRNLPRLELLLRYRWSRQERAAAQEDNLADIQRLNHDANPGPSFTESRALESGSETASSWVVSCWGRGETGRWCGGRVEWKRASKGMAGLHVGVDKIMLRRQKEEGLPLRTALVFGRECPLESCVGDCSWSTVRRKGASANGAKGFSQKTCSGSRDKQVAAAMAALFEGYGDCYDMVVSILRRLAWLSLAVGAARLSSASSKLVAIRMRPEYVSIPIYEACSCLCVVQWMESICMIQLWQCMDDSAAASGE
jgi:hypothetical protein